MDRTQVCGTCNSGSIPDGGTIEQSENWAHIERKFICVRQESKAERCASLAKPRRALRGGVAKIFSQENFCDRSRHLHTSKNFKLSIKIFKNLNYFFVI